MPCLHDSKAGDAITLASYHLRAGSYPHNAQCCIESLRIQLELAQRFSCVCLPPISRSNFPKEKTVAVATKVAISREEKLACILFLFLEGIWWNPSSWDRSCFCKLIPFIWKRMRVRWRSRHCCVLLVVVVECCVAFDHLGLYVLKDLIRLVRASFALKARKHHPHCRKCQTTGYNAGHV